MGTKKPAKPAKPPSTAGHLLHFRVTPEMARRVNTFARRHKITRSQAARLLIATGLGDPPKLAVMGEFLESITTRIARHLTDAVDELRQRQDQWVETIRQVVAAELR